MIRILHRLVIEKILNILSICRLHNDLILVVAVQARFKNRSAQLGGACRFICINTNLITGSFLMDRFLLILDLLFYNYDLVWFIIDIFDFHSKLFEAVINVALLYLSTLFRKIKYFLIHCIYVVCPYFFKPLDSYLT